MVIFQALVGSYDILILGKSPIKWRQWPDMTFHTVDLYTFAVLFLYISCKIAIMIKNFLSKFRFFCAVTLKINARSPKAHRHLLCLYNPLYKVKQIWCEDSVNLHVLPKFSKLFHYKDLENKVNVTKTK